MKKRTKKMNVGDMISQTIVYLFLGFYLICLFTPFIWGFLTSFKSFLYFSDHSLFELPDEWMWSNYTKVLKHLTITYTSATMKLTYNLGNMMLNSLWYALASGLSATVCVYVVAYARNMYAQFKIVAVIDVIVLITMSFPMVGSLPSSIAIFKSLGLYETFFGMTFIAKFSFLTMYYFIAGAFIKGIPKAFVEAAGIDGAGELQIMLRIMFPLTLPIFSTIFTLQFISYWNDYGTIFVFLKNFPTAAYGLWSFRGSMGNPEYAGTPMKLASAFIVVAPVLVVFAIFNKRIMNGVSLSEGVKE